MTAAMLLLLMMVHYKRVGTRNDLFARWRVWEIWVCANNKEHLQLTLARQGCGVNCVPNFHMPGAHSN